MTLLQHDLEQHEEVEVGAREINFVRHVAEILSLDSATVRRDGQL
jgi:deoxyribose-phosphate aldolase